MKITILAVGTRGDVQPYTMDQPFWGQRVAELGAGLQPLQRKHLTAPLLADAITATINNKAVKQCARILGEKINAEEGVARAVELMTDYLSSQ